MYPKKGVVPYLLSLLQFGSKNNNSYNSLESIVQKNSKFVNT